MKTLHCPLIIPLKTFKYEKFTSQGKWNKENIILFLSYQQKYRVPYIPVPPTMYLFLLLVNLVQYSSSSSQCKICPFYHIFLCCSSFFLSFLSTLYKMLSDICYSSDPSVRSMSVFQYYFPLLRKLSFIILFTREAIGRWWIT